MNACVCGRYFEFTHEQSFEVKTTENIHNPEKPIKERLTPRFEIGISCLLDRNAAEGKPTKYIFLVLQSHNTVTGIEKEA